MTRRRAIIGVSVLVAIAAAWWLLSDGLTAEERRLVGVWQHDEPGPPPWTMTLTLDSDRRFRVAVHGQSVMGDRDGGVWYVRGGRVYFDGEPSAVRRLLRPVFEFFGPRWGGVDLGTIGPRGELTVGTQVWTRVPAE